ncbi:MAG: tetratricopeptide repeat protein [Chloroflexi bacterium]|nr:tetratricopeptide repeat protein [Chloroflexota bacterium]
MQCPKCHSECPAEFDFCPRCATPLLVTCPQCGFRAPADFSFCPKCATALAPAAIAAERDTQAMLRHAIQRLIPRELAERLLATRGQVSTERRLVTILFCDVKGSTAMGESLDPEETLEIMNGAFEFLIPPVYRQEGTLAQILGDAILAFFGAPIAHEDDPERAIRAGLEIIAGSHEYAEHLERERGIRGFGVRVGINTGLVVVGELGADLQVQYTAVGEAINLAARMEQNAPVGGILITHDTYRHVRGVFDVEPQPPLAVKGKSKPVTTYVVLRAKPRAFRLETRGVEGVETRTIGREAEQQTLQNAYFDAVEGSETRAAIVSGDAGVGKSRLLYEFLNWAELRPEHFWLFKGRARAETQAVPYAVFRDLFVNRFEILESDSAATALAKFRTGMTGFLEPDRADLVGHMVGFDFSSSQAVHNLLDSPAFAQLATAYLRQYIRALTAQQPMLVVLEDMHWADDSTLDLVDRIVTEIPQARLLWVCLARPALFERRPHWGEGREAYVPLMLRPLSKRQSRALVAEILQKAPTVPEDLFDLILGSAEGNPFYIEELIKMLIEEGVIVRGEEQWSVELPRLKGLRVPPTLTGVLQARLDSLPHEARDVLQRASVVGRVFWDGAVAALLAGQPEGEPQTMPPADVLPLLDTVRERELVFRREHSSFAGSQEYIFKHLVLHDVTYETVLLKLRRRYHGQVALWLEANAGERVAEYAGQIAEHYERAGEPAMAAHWWRRVAEVALRNGAAREAVAAAEHGLSLLPEADKAEQAYFLSAIFEAHSRLGNYALARENADRALAVAIEIGDNGLAAWCLNRMAFVCYSQGDYPGLHAFARQALALARAAADPLQEALALMRLSDGVWLEEHDVVLAQRYLEESLAFLRQVADRTYLANCLNNLGEIPRALGDYAAAARYYEESLEVREQMGDRWRSTPTLFNLGEVAAAVNDHAAAARYAQQGLAIAEEVGFAHQIALCLGSLGHTAAASGDLGTARGYLQSALSQAIAINSPPVMLYVLVGLARLRALAGDLLGAAEWLGLALHHPSAENDVLGRANALLPELQAALPAQELEAALARGAVLELDAVVAEIQREAS